MVDVVSDDKEEFIESCRQRYRDRAAGIVDKRKIRYLVKKDKPPHNLCEIYLYLVTLRHNEKKKKSVYADRTTIMDETGLGYNRVTYILGKMEGLKIYRKEKKRYEILWDGIDMEAAKEAKNKLDGDTQ